MRYRITKEITFEASHQLMLHDGKCARLHGHSWKARICIGSDALQESGPQHRMVMDYADLKAMLKGLVDDVLDHHHLNHTMDSDSPTSEHVAAYIFGWVGQALALEKQTDQIPQAVELCWVEVDETCTSSCRYTPQQASEDLP